MTTSGMCIGGVRTLDDLNARCEEVGDCWEWQRYINTGNVPQVRYEGVPSPARRVAWEMVNGPVPEGKVITNTCSNFRCINPAHSKPTKPERLFGRNKSATTEALRRARISNTKRRQMGVAPSVVAAVRADTTTRVAQLAVDLGVSEATVYKLRRQALAASPWGGLLLVAG